MSTAEKLAANLDAMPYHSALAMLANRRNRLNGTFEAVKCVSRSSGDQLEGLIVFITADFAFRHLAPHSWWNRAGLV
jgi:hypothetical protein